MSAAPLGLLLLLSPLARGAEFAETVSATSFFKDNLHAHSNANAAGEYETGKGDGDSSPEAVLSWYAGHGYDFAFVTDHNELTKTSVAQGIELTSAYGKPYKPVHVNALCVDKPARGVYDRGGSESGVLAKTLAAAAGAPLVVVNHPNYGNALSLAAVKAAAGFNAIEIASGHGEVQKADAAAAASAEDMWDAALAERLSSGGPWVYAVAADDAHDFDGTIKEGEKELRAPGKAWVQAWRDSGGVCDALAAGHFYASTGPALKSLSVRGNELKLEVDGAWDAAKDRIEFLKKRSGKAESVAASSSTNPASYLADGSEGYVRARVTQAGKKAWTQAYRVK